MNGEYRTPAWFHNGISAILTTEVDPRPVLSRRSRIADAAYELATKGGYPDQRAEMAIKIIEGLIDEILRGTSVGLAQELTVYRLHAAKQAVMQAFRNSDPPEVRAMPVSAERSEDHL